MSTFVRKHTGTCTVGTQNFIHNSISVHYSGQKRSSKKGSWRFTLKACSLMDVRWSSIFSQVRNGFWKKWTLKLYDLCK